MAEDALTEIAYLQVFPLDGSQFTSLPPPILFNNSEAALDLKTLSIDGDGTYYCLSGDHTSVLFYSQAESAWVKTELPVEVTEVTGLHMQGQDGYLKFVNVDGAEALMRCTLTQSVAEDKMCIRDRRISGYRGRPRYTGKRYRLCSYLSLIHILIGLNYQDRSVLYDRINRRVDEMMAQGLLEEARTLLQGEGGKTALQAIGLSLIHI